MVIYNTKKVHISSIYKLFEVNERTKLRLRQAERRTDEQKYGRMDGRTDGRHAL